MANDTDCYHKAEPDEPKFTLLGRDPHAADLVTQWAAMREHAVAMGLAPDSDLIKVEAARKISAEMREFYKRYAERPMRHARSA